MKKLIVLLLLSVNFITQASSANKEDCTPNYPNLYNNRPAINNLAQQQDLSKLLYSHENKMAAKKEANRIVAKAMANGLEDKKQIKLLEKREYRGFLNSTPEGIAYRKEYYAQNKSKFAENIKRHRAKRKAESICDMQNPNVLQNKINKPKRIYTRRNTHNISNNLQVEQNNNNQAQLQDLDENGQKKRKIEDAQQIFMLKEAGIKTHENVSDLKSLQAAQILQKKYSSNIVKNTELIAKIAKEAGLKARIEALAKAPFDENAANKACVDACKAMSAKMLLTHSALQNLPVTQLIRNNDNIMPISLTKPCTRTDEAEAAQSLLALHSASKYTTLHSLQQLQA